MLSRGCVVIVGCYAFVSLLFSGMEAAARDGRGGGGFGIGVPHIGGGLGGGPAGGIGSTAPPRNFGGIGSTAPPRNFGGIGGGRIGGIPSTAPPAILGGPGRGPAFGSPRLRSFGPERFGTAPTPPQLRGFGPNRFNDVGRLPRFGTRSDLLRGRQFRSVPGEPRGRGFVQPPGIQNPGLRNRGRDASASLRRESRRGEALLRQRDHREVNPQRQRPVNEAAFRRGNGFERKPFGGHRWREGKGRHRHIWAGGIFWPYFLGDTFSYALWPASTYDTFWTTGPESILSGALWPAGEGFYAGDIYAGAGEVYSGYAGGGEGKASSQQVAALCSGLAPGVVDLPVGRFERIIKPTSKQRVAFNELKQAAAKASRVLETACPKQTPLTPVARLDAMQQRFAAMQQAVAIIRGPLKRLYDLLSDAQKRRLEQAAGEQNGRGAASLDIAQLCSAQSGFTTVPTDDIARAISLSDEQQFDLNKLREASEQAAQGLRASCPAGAPRSIGERLDAAQKRIAALIQAIEIIRPAASKFYASLSEQQQAALKVQGRESRTARR